MTPYNFDNISDSHDPSFKRDKDPLDMMMAPDDYSRMLRTIKNRPGSRSKRNRDYLIFLLMGNMGLRVGEAAILKFSDFKNIHDTSLPYAKVTALKKEDPRARKVIYLHETIADAVKRYIRGHRQKHQPYLFPGKAKPGSVTGFDSGHFSHRQIARIFQHYCTVCRFKREYSTHCMRHMYYSIVLERCANRVFLRDQMGHSAVPELGVGNTYAHLTNPKVIRECIQDVGAIL